MAKVFEITTAATDPLKTDANGRAETVFTVTNITSRPLRGLAKIKPLGNTKQEWIKLVGENERDYAAGATHQLTVTFDAQGPVPPGGAAAATGAPAPGTAPAPGKYGVKVVVASASNPDEDFAENTATFEVPAREEKKKAAFPIWIIPVIAVALIVIGVTLWLILRNGSAKEVTVPAVRGQSKEAARKLLEANCEPEPCFVINEETKSDPTVAKDQAIGTDPAENETVAAGSEVKLIVSAGPELVAVPPVNNQTKEFALTLLKAFTVNEVSKPDPTVAKGRAVGTDPAENQMAAPGSPITLFISSGPELVKVTDYTGVSLEQAKRLIEADGFTLGNVAYVYEGPGQIGNVIDQIPNKDKKHPKGAPINLTVKTLRLIYVPAR